MKRIIEKALRNGGDQAELFVIESKDFFVVYENGVFKRLDQTERQGGALRLFKEGRLGFATTTDFEQSDALVHNALRAAQFGTPFQFEFSSNKCDDETEPYDSQIESLTEKQLVNMGSQAMSHIKNYDPNILVSCSIGKSIQTISCVTSNGMEGSYDRSLFSFLLRAELTEKGNFLENHDGIEQTQVEFDLGSYLSSVLEPFRHGRKNVTISSGKYNVILTPRALSSLFWALELGLSGKNVALGISPLKDKLTRQVLDPRVILDSDGKLKGGAYTAPFDDEGTPTKKNNLFRHGILENYLLDLRSAEELNMYPTGNGLRSGKLYMSKDYLELPRCAVNSWVMEGGERQFEEIFCDVKNAVLIDQMMGLLMSTQVNGDFSGKISLGYKIQNGRILGRIKDCLLAGNIYELLSEKHLLEIAQERRWICGAYGGTHMLPALFLKEVFISA